MLRPGASDAPGEPVGIALYFFNYSTWTGRPGLYVRRIVIDNVVPVLSFMDDIKARRSLCET